MQILPDFYVVVSSTPDLKTFFLSDLPVSSLPKHSTWFSQNCNSLVVLFTCFCLLVMITYWAETTEVIIWIVKNDYHHYHIVEPKRYNNKCTNKFGSHHIQLVFGKPTMQLVGVGAVRPMSHVFSMPWPSYKGDGMLLLIRQVFLPKVLLPYSKVGKNIKQVSMWGHV